MLFRKPMVEEQNCRELALSFPEVTEQPHFEKTSFRVAKKIFATLHLKENRICVKLPEIEQDVFCSYDRKTIWPVPNKWGKMGWTLVDLRNIGKDMLYDMLRISYCAAAPKRLADLINTNEDLNDI